MKTTSTNFSKTIFTLAIFAFGFNQATALNTEDHSNSITKTITEKNLPLAYSFDVTIINNRSIALKWITSAEKNINHFEVERSFDQVNFKTVALVLDGFSTDTDQKTYMFKENKTELNGKTSAYYRLKQIDVNGQVNYSKALLVTVPAPTESKLNITPNPFTDNLNVSFNSNKSGLAEIQILNSKGQTILSKQSNIVKGNNNLQVESLGKLNTGMYVARVMLNGVVIDNQKVIKN